MLPTLILVGGSNFYTLLQPFMFGIMNNTAEVLPLMIMRGSTSAVLFMMPNMNGCRRV